MKIKKKSLHMIGILLCICAVVFCGVFYYLSNYNLKIWYTLQNEETQQEARTLMRQYIKLSDGYWEYALQRDDFLQEYDKLTDDFVQAKAEYERFLEIHGEFLEQKHHYGALDEVIELRNELCELEMQYKDLQQQRDDLMKKYEGGGLVMEDMLSCRDEIGDKIRELGFRGEPRTFEMEEIMNDN